LCKKQLEREHVIPWTVRQDRLNEVKDLGPELQVVFDCGSEILRLRLTCAAPPVQAE
jgi:hypothetical protein